MSDASQTKVGRVIRERREQMRLSVRGLAAAANVDSTWLSRVELGIYVNPDPRYLHRLAQVLEVPTLELFMAADYSDGLPSFAPYFRSKYQLPPEAIDQLKAHFDLLAAKYDRHNGEEGGTNDEHHSRAA